MIAGIDYSMSSPGFCYIGDKIYLYALSGTKKYIGVWETDKFRLEVEEYPSWCNNMDRFHKLAEWSVGKCLKHKVEHIVLEGYAMGAKGQVFSIAENTGLLKHILMSFNISIDIVSPAELKGFATTKGNAKKDLMVSTFTDETGIDLAATIGCNKPTGAFISDVVDAYWLCQYDKKPYETILNTFTFQ